MLKSRQVEAFRAVMLAGGITPASELMSVSQPAVTRLIHDLQSALGLKLFERRGARLVRDRWRGRLEFPPPHWPELPILASAWAAGSGGRPWPAE